MAARSRRGEAGATDSSDTKALWVGGYADRYGRADGRAANGDRTWACRADRPRGSGVGGGGEKRRFGARARLRRRDGDMVQRGRGGRHGRAGVQRGRERRLTQMLVRRGRRQSKKVPAEDRRDAAMGWRRRTRAAGGSIFDDGQSRERRNGQCARRGRVLPQRRPRCKPRGDTPNGRAAPPNVNLSLPRPRPPRDGAVSLASPTPAPPPARHVRPRRLRDPGNIPRAENAILPPIRGRSRSSVARARVASALLLSRRRRSRVRSGVVSDDRCTRTLAIAACTGHCRQ